MRTVRLWIEKPHPGGLNLDSTIAGALRYLRLELLGTGLVPDRQRLLITPEGILHQFPFAVLPQSATGEYIPIVNAHELVMLPSASVGGMIHARPARTMRAGRIAVFADPLPAREASTERLASVSIAAGNAPELLFLAPLTFSRQEGDSIADIQADAERYFDFRATPDNAIAALKSLSPLFECQEHRPARSIGAKMAVLIVFLALRENLTKPSVLLGFGEGGSGAIDEQVHHPQCLRASQSYYTLQEGIAGTRYL